MRRGFWLMTLLLPLGGCYMAPDAGYGYGQPGYAQPGYGPGGYAPAPYDPYAEYPGYSYNDGAPTIVEGGVGMPLVFFGGQWGYYDRDREWHHAPEGVSRDLDRHRAEAGHYRPGPPPRGEPPREARPGPFGGPAPFHPNDQRRAGPPPDAAPRPATNPAPRPATNPAPRPATNPAFPGARPGPPAGPPPGGAPRGAPRPESGGRGQQREHDRNQRCPPGQRC